MGRRTRTISEIVDEYIEKTDTCWIWKGTITPNGYGKYTNGGAHRLIYESLVSKIPEGMHLDRLCRVRSCVNPTHLEPVTPGENLLRSKLTWNYKNSVKTHCKHGHKFSEDNTYINPDGNRECRHCRHLANKRRQDKIAATRRT